MKCLFFLSIIWLGTAHSSATAKGPVWSQGKLQLMTGAVLEGKLNYNWKAEIVQIQQEGGVKSYSAFQVESFKYFDDVQNTIRTFVAYDYPVRTTLHRPIFLEECLVGPMRVYRRLRHLRDPIPVVESAAYNRDDELVKDIDNFTYYVVEGDKVYDLDRFLHDLWPRLRSEYGDELKRYVDSLRMDLNNTLARLLLINHYNALKLQAAEATPVNNPPVIGQ